MIQEPLQQEILTRIDKLAEKLGVTVEYLWPQLVRLTVIETLSGFMLVAALIVAASLCWRQRGKTESYDAQDGWLVAAVIVSILAGVGILLAVTLGIPILLEPEAATLRGLLQ